MIRNRIRAMRFDAGRRNIYIRRIEADIATIYGCIRALPVGMEKMNRCLRATSSGIGVERKYIHAMNTDIERKGCASSMRPGA